MVSMKNLIASTLDPSKFNWEPGFIDHESDNHFNVIVKRHQLQVTPEQISGFERSQEAPADAKPAKGQPPVKGKRKSKKDKLREMAATQEQDK
jgi:ATP-dependent RNA helicase RhlE